MPGILEPRVNDWLLKLAGHGEPLLEEMEAYAREHKFPIVGPECGRVLRQVALLTNAKRVFEMGSGYGYSTLWFARALPADGRVFHTDGDPANTAKAREYLTRAGLQDRVAFKTGDALESLARTPGEFDVIFVDVDKHQYPEAFEQASARVRVGGAVLFHNALWSGRVADPAVSDKNTDGIRELVRRAWDSKDFLSSLMPMDDGLSLSVRLR